MIQIRPLQSDNMTRAEAARDERKAAAASLSEKDAVALINGILDRALTGEASDILVKRLSQIPKRGGK